MKKKFGDLDEFLFYSGDVKIEDVLNQLSSESLFSSATCIVLKNAELIKKEEDLKMISDWINSASIQSNALILVSDENSVDSKLDKLIPKENKKIFWEMFENQKEQWLNNFFRKNGYKTEPDVCSMILDMVENNTEALKTECSRFFMCFSPDHVITENDVENILAHNREESAFTLFNAMCGANDSPAKRLETSLLILQKILMSKTVSGAAVMLIAGLASCFRKLSVWGKLCEAGHVPSETELKSNGFSSKKQQMQYRNASRIWTAGQCAAIISLLAETDMAVRSSGMQFAETQLTLLLYEIIIKKGLQVEKYENL